MRYARLGPLDMDTEQLRDAAVAVVGAGATGSRMLDQLARIGADIHIIDRDYLEAANLATSALYTEEQAGEGLPKAVAAAEQLRAITDDAAVTAEVADLDHRTVDTYLAGADVVLDGTDNMATRHLINEYCVTHGVPWVHVAALGQRGQVMPVLPGKTPCFNCVFGRVDGAALATCETAGISPAAAAIAASLGVSAAIDILDGNPDSRLTRFDLSRGRFDQLAIAEQGCRVCSEGSFPYLNGEAGATATTVCGEDKYQVSTKNGDVDLAELASQLQAVGDVTRNEHLLQFDGDEQFTVFRDGRMIVAAESREAAKSIYGRFIGS